MNREISCGRQARLEWVLAGVRRFAPSQDFQVPGSDGNLDMPPAVAVPNTGRSVEMNCDFSEQQ